MAQNINRRPKGLQSLLDSKNLGVNPSVLSETVAPTLEITDLLYVDIPLILAKKNETITSGSILTPSAIIEIPVGETWAVKAWGGTVTPVAADSLAPLSFAPGLLPIITKTFVLAGAPSADPGITPILEATGFGQVFERPLILTGGNRLCIVPLKVQGLVGNAAALNSVAYWRLDT